MNRGLWILRSCVLFFLLLCACSGEDYRELEPGDDSQPDGDGESFSEDEVDPDNDEESGEETSDGDIDGDIDGEADEETIRPLDLPVEPSQNPSIIPMTDEPYLQEFNHTIAEQPAGLEALSALFMPPDSFVDFDRPTLAAARGLWRDTKTDAPILVELPTKVGDIVDIEVLGDAVYLLCMRGLVQVGEDFLYTALIPMPEESEPIGLFPGDGGIYILTTTSMTFFFEQDDPVWVELNPAPSAALLHEGKLLLAWEDRLAAYDPAVNVMQDNELWRVDLAVGTPVAIIASRSLPQPLDLVVVGSERPAGFSLVDDTATPVDVPLFADGRVPLAGARRAVADSNGGFIVAAEGGAYRIIERDLGFEYRVYVPERWMPTGDVRDVLIDDTVENGPIYFATSGGLGWMTRRMWTIADKSDQMIERIVLRHDRDGALSDSHLLAPGDLSTNIPWDSDNDGGWTCYWVLSECFRYKLTGDEEAKAHFDKSLARMLSLRTLTGTEHFLARSVIRKEGCVLDDCDDPDDGEWFTSPDGEWWVKADTSNDEVTSHMFMMGHAYDLCADDDQRQAIVEHVDGIIGGIIENGYQLIDPQDGECTSYGQFDPEYVNEWFSGPLADGGRRSAQMLGAINLAHYLTGKQKYLDAKSELMEQHHYHDNIQHIGDEEQYPFCAGSGDCDELAFQAFVPLLRYESDPELREMWMVGWRRLYSHLIEQEDAFWDISNAVFEGENIDFSFSKRWYRDYPTDLVRWPIRNQVRQDAIEPPEYYLVKESNDNYKRRSDGHIFPADERPNIRHNTPQFQYSGGWGSLRELDGGDALFPYWYGRFYGFIEVP